ncbi:MAG TPA: DUF4397 domain-containing protein [Epulopiscium sp.]|nr:DUF4397 domain-containing protein [Candidatus Epulonipiscium sp.]
MYPSFYRKEQPTTSYIRVFHTSPNSPAVDVYANDDLIVENLSYGKISPYIPVPAANYKIKVYPTGKIMDPVINTEVYIPSNIVFNVAAIGTLPNLSLYPVPEPSIAQNSGNACVRFVHLSPNAPAVDVKLDNGTMVFDNVAYKGITNYTCIPAGTYTFKVSPAGSKDVVLTVPDVKLDANIYYTIYAIGLVGEEPSLQAILITEPRED